MITHLHLLLTLRISPFHSIGLLGVVHSYAKGQLCFIKMCQNIRMRNVKVHIGFNGLPLSRNSCVLQCSLLHLLLRVLVIEAPQPSHSYKETVEFALLVRVLTNWYEANLRNNTTTRITLHHKWGRLHKNNIYEYKQRQIDTNISLFVYGAKVFRYMFRPSRGHHRAYLHDYSISLVPSNATQRMYSIQFILFHFIKITTCFDHFIWSSSDVYKMYNKRSLELLTTLRQIWAHIYNDVWWITMLANVNNTY
jgi:hypothetical protein